MMVRNTIDIQHVEPDISSDVESPVAAVRVVDSTRGPHGRVLQVVRMDPYGQDIDQRPIELDEQDVTVPVPV